MAALALFCLFAGPTARADIFNVSWDNDLLVGADQGYTNGLRLSYLSAPADANAASSALPKWGRLHLGRLPGVKGSDQQAVSVSLKQLMVTPKDISRKRPSRDDLPYAGYLSASSALWSWSDLSITGYGIELGVVGPESGAEASQRWVHNLTGSESPKGWDNQLGTDIVGGVHVTHARKVWHQAAALEQEFSWVASVKLSSFRTGGRVGAVWRIGDGLPVNFVPDYAGASNAVSLPGSFSAVKTGWSLFLGVGLEYVAYSYLEDQADDYAFEQSPVLLQAGAGATWRWQNFQTALILRATTGEEETNKERFSYGTLSFSWAY